MLKNIRELKIARYKDFSVLNKEAANQNSIETADAHALHQGLIGRSGYRSVSPPTFEFCH